MTNLILTVIGIILAAIAALVAFDYGGDYFLEGYARAEAATISNAGNNVSAAYSVFGVQRRRPPGSLQELTSSTQGRSLLKRIPQVQDLGVVRDQWMGLDRGLGVERAFVVEGLSLRLCRTLNQRLNGFADDAVVPGAPAFKSGCFAYNGTTVNVYYTFLGGVPEGGTLAPYSPVTAGAPLPPPPTVGGGSGGVDDPAAWPSVPENSPPPLPRPTPTDPAPVNDAGWVDCASDGSVCGFSGEATVRYGTGSSFYYLTAAAQTACSASTFGGDPSPGDAKSCSYRIIPQQDGWTFCSNEGAACSFGRKMQAEVRYGSVGSYVVKKLVDGASCSNATLGSDPAAGRAKACYYRNVEPQPVAPPVPEVPTNPTVGVEPCTSGGVVGTSTQVDPDGIVSSVLPLRICRGDAVLSPGGRFRLSLQTDGNLVLAAVGSDTSMWASNTGGGDVTHLDAQVDGNAVLYNNSNDARWSTGTYGWRGTMRLSSDGNLTVYDSAGARIVWETRTDVCVARSVSGGSGMGAYGRASTLVPTRLCNNEYVDSPDGRFRLTMRPDGNLALAMGDSFAQTIWSSNTASAAPYKLNVQPDGNSVLYGRDGGAKWSTGTYGWNGARMMVETDGNVSVWNAAGDRLLWETRTDHCLPSRVADGRRTGDFGVSGTVVPTRVCNNEFVESPDGRFRLIMQDDGDLSLRMGDAYETQIWHSGTSDAYKLETQSGGNLVLVKRDGGSSWSTGTSYNDGSRMILQSDGNLVVRSADNSRLLWETRSVYCLPRETASGTNAGDYDVLGARVPDRLCGNEYVTSPNGTFRLTMLPNGNLVLATGANYGTVVWQTGTSDFYGLFVQGNGDVRLYRRDGFTASVSNTPYNDGARMFLQDDGNLVVRSRDNTRLLWQSNSIFCTPAERGVGTVAGWYGVIGTSAAPRVCTNEYVTSPNKRFRLTMRADGNLVLGQGAGYSDVIWSTNTTDYYGLFVQGNGDMRLYRRDGFTTSFTNTPYNDGAKLSVQDDGNLVVRSGDNTKLLWESRTDRCLPAEVGKDTRVGGYGVNATLVPSRICNNEYVTSPNGLFRLVMKPDGKLDLLTGSDFSTSIWSTQRADGYKLEMQGNGDVRIYSRDGGSQSISGTPYNDGARLMVQDDGNLVVRSADNSRLLWETRTDLCQPAEVGGELGVDNLGTTARMVRSRICNNEYVTSPNGRFRLTMQADGNLTIGMGDAYKDVVWSSGTGGSGGYKLESQGDGNVVIYNRGGGAVWSTGTNYNDGARLMLNDLGNLVVMRNGSLLWESRSDHCLPASLSAGVEISPSGIGATRMPLVICQNEWVDSPNGRFRLTLNPQGDLQLLDGVNHDVQLWHSGTNDPSIYRFWSWSDGNHWLMDRAGRNRWSTGTSYNNGARLLVQNDGNVVVYSTGNSVLWQTNTGGRTGPVPGSPEDQALTVRRAGATAYGNAGFTVAVPATAADLGMDSYDYSGKAAFSRIARGSERVVFELKLTGDSAGSVCTAIAKAVGGDVNDTSREFSTQEGCASYTTGYYYWRRIDDAQAGAQASFVRAFGAAVHDGAAQAKAQPTSLSDVGMDGAQVFNLLDRPGFERAGENWRFVVRVDSAEACRAIDAAVGNPTRQIDAYNGVSYLLAEGCGGSRGSYYYWRNVNDAYDGRIADAVRAAGYGAVAAAMANGGESSQTGRDAAQSSLVASLANNGFALNPGVVQAGDHYTAEMGIVGASTCRALDRSAGNGDRGSLLVYDAVNLEEGCGAAGDGGYRYWRRLQPAGHRFWRILAYRSAGEESLVAASEIEFHASAGGADITDGAGGSPIASSSYSSSDPLSGSYRAGYAFDNDPGTGNWASANGPSATQIGAWIGYDFGAGKAVNVVEATWRSRYDCCTSQSIGSGAVQWSDDGSAWNTSFEFQADPTTTNGQVNVLRPTIVTDPNAHRFWRIRGFATNDPYMRSSEIEMRESSTGPNVARFGTPMAYSYYSGGYSPFYAFNGTTGGNAWASANGFSSGRDWIGVDLLIPRNITEIRYASAEGPKAPTDFAVEWSDDGSNWNQSWRVTYSAWGNTELRTFSKADYAPAP